MKHSTNTFEIDNLGEVLVGFDYEFKSYCNEDTGHNIVDESSIELTSVEVVFGGIGFDILPQLPQKIKDYIIKKIEIKC